MRINEKMVTLFASSSSSARQGLGMTSKSQRELNTDYRINRVSDKREVGFLIKSE